MAKKKRPKNRPARKGGEPLKEEPKAVRAEWDSVESAFFAREAELYRVSPVESFEDLDAE